MNNYILTLNNLWRRGFVLLSICPLSENEEEEVNHLFLHYPFVFEIWAKLFDSFRCKLVIPKMIALLCMKWESLVVIKRLK